MAYAQHDRLQSGVDAGLVEDVRDVVALGPVRDLESPSDAAAIQAVTEGLQHLELARREARDRGVFQVLLLAPASVEAEELDDLRQGHQRLARPQPADSFD